MLITHIMAAIRRWISYRATIAELSNLNDRDLADLGISRSDIRAIAHEGSYGR